MCLQNIIVKEIMSFYKIVLHKMTTYFHKSHISLNCIDNYFNGRRISRILYDVQLTKEGGPKTKIMSL